MSAKRKYRNRSQPTTLAVPSDYLATAKALLLLLDEGDEELLELLERRFLPLPPTP